METNLDIKSIILFKEKNENYFLKLESIKKDIRILESIHNEIKINSWDLNLKYRRLWDKPLSKFSSKFYLERGKWTDFILTSGIFIEGNINKLNPFSLEEISSTKLITALLLFLRDIANNLKTDNLFKLQLKLELNFSIENFS